MFNINYINYLVNICF